MLGWRRQRQGLGGHSSCIPRDSRGLRPLLRVGNPCGPFVNPIDEARQSDVVCDLGVGTEGVDIQIIPEATSVAGVVCHHAVGGMLESYSRHERLDGSVVRVLPLEDAARRLVHDVLSSVSRHFLPKFVHLLDCVGPFSGGHHHWTVERPLARLDGVGDDRERIGTARLLELEHERHDVEHELESCNLVGAGELAAQHPPLGHLHPRTALDGVESGHYPPGHHAVSRDDSVLGDNGVLELDGRGGIARSIHKGVEHDVEGGAVRNHPVDSHDSPLASRHLHLGGREGSVRCDGHDAREAALVQYARPQIPPQIIGRPEGKEAQ
mmetsp:Transcript_12135/g.35478  ORF Transcript_12135/g.35478 Transcript_12135/m.35478 type:complete len:323 (+) Transcript_12135:1253-2221(+)